MNGKSEKKKNRFKNWQRRLFAGILSFAMIATSFSGDIENLIRAEEDPNNEPIVGYEDNSVDPAYSEGLEGSEGSEGFVTPADPNGQEEDNGIEGEGTIDGAVSGELEEEFDNGPIGAVRDEEFMFESAAAPMMATFAAAPRAYSVPSDAEAIRAGTADTAPDMIIEGPGFGKTLPVTKVNFELAYPSNPPKLPGETYTSPENALSLTLSLSTPSKNFSYTQNYSVPLDGSLPIEVPVSNFEIKGTENCTVSLSINYTTNNDYVYILKNTDFYTVIFGTERTQTYTVKATPPVLNLYAYGADDEPAKKVKLPGTVSGKTVDEYGVQIDIGGGFTYEPADSSTTVFTVDSNSGVVTANEGGTAKVITKTDDAHKAETPVNVYSLYLKSSKKPYNGAEQPPEVTYKAPGVERNIGTEVFSNYTSFKDAGEYRANYNLSYGNAGWVPVSLVYTIERAEYANASGDVFDLYPVDTGGTAWRGEIRRASTSEVLKCGEDFSVKRLAPPNYTDVGVASYDVEINFIKNYKGTYGITLNPTATAANPLDISDKIFIVPVNNDIYYTGEEICPGSNDGKEYGGPAYIKLQYDDGSRNVLLTSVYDENDRSVKVYNGTQSDATYMGYITYADNINSGWATMTFHGDGKYIGTVEKRFYIQSRNINELNRQNRLRIEGIPTEPTIIDGAPVTFPVKVWMYPSGTNKDIDPDVAHAKLLTTDGANPDIYISYEGNTTPGYGYLFISGSGTNFVGGIPKDYELVAPMKNADYFFYDVRQGQVRADRYSVTYTGKAITPEVRVYIDGHQLIEDVDYKVSEPVNNINHGTATVYVEGKGKYKGQPVKELTFQITKAELPETFTINLQHDRRFINGKTEPLDKSECVISGISSSRFDEEVRIIESVDSADNHFYDDSGSGIVSGTVTVTIEAKADGNYIGRSTGTYEIKKAADWSDVYFDDVPSKIYNGQPQTVSKAEITAIMNGQPLNINSARFSIDPDGYSNNIESGTAKLTLRGVDFETETEIEFKIRQIELKDLTIYAMSLSDYQKEVTAKYGNPKNITNWSVFDQNYSTAYRDGSFYAQNCRLEYNGTTRWPQIIVKDAGGKVLDWGTHYNFNPDTSYVTYGLSDYYYAKECMGDGGNRFIITGMGSYGGGTNTAYLYFTITPKDISKCAGPADSDVTYDSGTKKVTVAADSITDPGIIVSGSNKPLEEGRDYKVEYDLSDVSTAGFHEVIIRGAYDVEQEIDGRIMHLGNYTGTKMTGFRTGKNLADPSIKFKIADVDATPGVTCNIPYTGSLPSISIKDEGPTDPKDRLVDLATATAGTPADYRVEYVPNTPVGAGETGTIKIWPVTGSRSSNYYYCVDGDGRDTCVELKYEVAQMNLAQMKTEGRIYYSLDGGNTYVPMNANPDTEVIPPFDYDGGSHNLVGKVYVKVGENQYYKLSDNNPRDYTLSYEDTNNCLDGGMSVKDVDARSTYVITGSGNFTGQIKCKISVQPRPVEKWTVNLSLPQENGSLKLFKYTHGSSGWTPDSTAIASPTGETIDGSGDPLKGILDVYDGTTKLIKDTDYTVTVVPGTNKDIGDAQITLRGKENYSGSDVVLEFKIAAIQDFQMTISPASVEYEADSGNIITQGPVETVTSNGKTLEKDTNYTLSYINSTNTAVTDLKPGKYKVKATGKTPYSGTAESPFTVTCNIGTNPAVKVNQSASVDMKDDGTIDVDDLHISVEVDGVGTLVKGTDYTVSAAPSPLKVGPGNKITITGKGNYSGSITKDFTVMVNLEYCRVQLNGGGPDSNVFDTFPTGAFDPILTVYLPGTNGELAPSMYTKEPGSGLVTVAGMHSGIIKPSSAGAPYLNNQKEFHYYLKYNLAKAVVKTVDNTDLPTNLDYPGDDKAREIMSTAKVTVYGTPLDTTYDYEVKSVTRNESTGTITVTLTAKEGSTTTIGTKIVTFKEDTLDLNKDGKGKITIIPATFTYDGTPKTLSFTVQYGTKDLVEGKDYTARWSQNINAGNAVLTVTGKGGYTGTLTDTTSLRIEPLELTQDIVDASGTVTTPGNSTFTSSSVVYRGTSFGPDDAASLSTTLTCLTTNKILTSDDYTVTIETNTYVDASTTPYPKVVKATGKGNYKGSIYTGLLITPAEISDLTIANASSYYTGSPQQLDFKVKWGNKDLVEDTDYTVDVHPMESVTVTPYKTSGGVWMVQDKGPYTITVTGKGNFKGQKRVEYRVVSRKINADYVKIYMKNKNGTVTYYLEPEMDDTDSARKTIKYYTAKKEAGDAYALSYDSIEAFNRDTPAITELYDTGTSLTIPTDDYEVTYHNINVGDANDPDNTTPYILIKAVKNYEEEVKIYFSLGTTLYDNPRTSVLVLGNKDEEFRYDGTTEFLPNSELVDVQVKYNDRVLEKDVDYTIEWDHSKDYYGEGLKTFTIVGKASSGFYGKINDVQYKVENGTYIPLSPNQCWYYVNPKRVNQSNISIGLDLPYDETKGGYYAYYNGNNITPKVTVTDTDLGSVTGRLEEGKDYDVVYTNNKEVSGRTSSGSRQYALATINWKRNYEWDDSAEQYAQKFVILPIEMSANDFKVDWTQIVGTNSVTPFQNVNTVTVPKYQVTKNVPGTETEILTYGVNKDYIVDYEDMNGERYEGPAVAGQPSSGSSNPDFAGFKAGRMNLIVKGVNNYSGEVKKEYIIQANLADVTDANCSFVRPFYTGSIPIPTGITASCGGNVLDLPTSDDLVPSANNEVVWDNGKFMITFTGSDRNKKGEFTITSHLTEYTGALVRNYDAETQLDKITVDNGYKTHYKYTREPIELEYDLIVGGNAQLSDAVTRIVTYYTGIDRANPSSTAPINARPEAYYFSILLKLDDEQMYVGENAAGEPHLFPFFVDPRDISRPEDGVSIAHNSSTYYTGEKIDPAKLNIMVFYDRKELSQYTEYTMTFAPADPLSTLKDNKSATPYVEDFDPALVTGEFVVEGHGNYTGKVVCNYQINPAAADNLDVVQQSENSLYVSWHKNDVVDTWVVTWRNRATQEIKSVELPYRGINAYLIEDDDLMSGTSYEVSVTGKVRGIEGKTLYKNLTTTVAGVSSVSGIAYTDPYGVKSAIITWNAVPGASGYEVIKAENVNGPYRLRTNFPANSAGRVSFGDKQVTAGTTYYYKVRAYTRTPAGIVYASDFSDYARVSVP